MVGVPGHHCLVFPQCCSGDDAVLAADSVPASDEFPGESDIVDRRTAEAVPVAVYDGLTAKGEDCWTC